MGEKGPSRNVKRSVDSPCARFWERDSISISLFIDLFISVFNCFLGSYHQLFLYTESSANSTIREVLFENQMILYLENFDTCYLVCKISFWNSIPVLMNE